MLISGGRTGVAVSALAAFALLASGCTGSGGGGGAAGDRNGGSAAAPNQINPVAYDKVASGGVLHYPLNQPIANFNSYELNGNNVNTAAIVGPMLPSLFTIDGKDAFRFNANYLTGEPKVTTAPAQTMTYEINPKAKWSDGTPISYKDFISQWQALNGSDPNYTLQLSAAYSRIASVARGATDQEVVVTLKPGVVDADWRGLFSPLYPLSATDTPDAFNSGWKSKPLVSGGPFMFGSSTPTSYTLVRNPQWWGRAPKLSSVEFDVINTLPETVAALTAHKIDVQDVGQDVDTYDQVKGVAGISVRTAGGPDYRAVTFNGARPDLSDVKVRQAISLGIDRAAIAQAELRPLGITNPVPPNDHIFQVNQVGYQDNAGGLGNYNPTQAKQMLDAAGWVDDPATHTRTKSGKKLTLSFVVPDGVALSLSEAQLVQQQLAKIDVGVTIKKVNLSNFLNGYVHPGNYDLTVFSWLGDSFPISSASTIYESVQPGNDWQENYSRVSVPQVTTLFKQAEANLDQAAANAAANQADALIWQNAMSLPLYQRPDVWAVNSKVANFGAFGFATIDWTAVGFTSTSS
ncbi:MAG TPA: ABC transporter family substrate-binding protein [Micromonosporaceae bacterium]